MTREAGMFAAGVGLGAAMMYFLDPDRGTRRRTHARNQMIQASHRMRDVAREQREALRRAQQSIDDSALADRARAMLGQVVSRAQALALEASRGVVTVSGPIAREEIRLALKALKRVPGVQRVVNALEPHPAPQRMWRDRRLTWAGDRGTGTRVAAALASAAGIGLMARAAMNARANVDDIELRS